MCTNYFCHKHGYYTPTLCDRCNSDRIAKLLEELREAEAKIAEAAEIMTVEQVREWQKRTAK